MLPSEKKEQELCINLTKEVKWNTFSLFLIQLTRKSFKKYNLNNKNMVEMHTNTLHNLCLYLFTSRLFLTWYILSASTEFSLMAVVSMYNPNTQKEKVMNNDYKGAGWEKLLLQSSKQYRRLIAHDYQDKQNGKWCDISVHLAQSCVLCCMRVLSCVVYLCVSICFSYSCPKSLSYFHMNSKQAAASSLHKEIR